MKPLSYLLPVLLITLVAASCSRSHTNVDTSFTESANNVIQNLCVESNSTKLIQESNMISYKKQVRDLMVNQNYQEALDLMPKMEEVLENVSPEDLFWEQEGNRTTYYFLYVALGRDHDALEKMMEYKLPNDIGFFDAKTVSQLEFKMYFDKMTVMSRLNMVDEIIDETNVILGNHTIMNAFSGDTANSNVNFDTDSSWQLSKYKKESSLQMPKSASESMRHSENLPYVYENLLILLASAQIIKSDMKSAQTNLDQVRNMLDNCPDKFRRTLHQFYLREVLMQHEY